MKFFRTTKKLVKPLVDVPTWLGYKQLVDMSNSVGRSLKSLFIPTKAGRQETFEQALERLNLTEADIQRRSKEFTRLFIISLIAALLIIVYAFYLMWQGSWHGTIASLAISTVFLAWAFRYHFWLFQIRQRRLGCTLREWLGSSFMGEEK